MRFLWQTILPVTVEGNTATISGKRGAVRIEAPAGTSIGVEKLPLARGEQNRIYIEKTGKQGVLDVKILLLPPGKSK